MTPPPLLSLRGVSVRYGTGRNALTAVRDVDLDIPGGGTLGLVGESGSGKSTLGRAIAGIETLSSGSVLSSSGTRPRIGMVFQNPRASFNPRMTVHEALAEAWGTVDPVSRRFSLDAVGPEVLGSVGLGSEALARYPHEFSGGQLQRIAIGRMLASQPDVVVLDEVTSALDVGVQATILGLLRKVQQEFDLSYLFISHDLAVVRQMSHTVAVMYLGKIVEHGPAAELFESPRHPYTRMLIDSVPQLGVPVVDDLVVPAQEPPDPRTPPSGCVFRTRCPIGPEFRTDRTACRSDVPNPVLDPAASPDGYVACHFPLDGSPTHRTDSKEMHHP